MESLGMGGDPLPPLLGEELVEDAESLGLVGHRLLSSVSMVV